MNMVTDNYDGQMIAEDERGPNLLTFIIQLRENPGKNLNQETGRTGHRTRECCVRGNDLPLDHSGGQCMNSNI